MLLLLLLILPYDKAIETGKRVSQPVVIQVEMPGCLPCARLKKELNKRKDFIYTTIDHKDERLNKYNVQTPVLPHIIILYNDQLIGHGQVSTTEAFDILLKASMKNVKHP